MRLLLYFWCVLFIYIELYKFALQKYLLYTSCLYELQKTDSILYILIHENHYATHCSTREPYNHEIQYTFRFKTLTVFFLNNCFKYTLYVCMSYLLKYLTTTNNIEIQYKNTTLCIYNSVLV